MDPNGASAPVATASALLPGGDTLREVTLDVSRFRGRHGRLVLIDDSELGHLDIDDVLLLACCPKRLPYLPPAAAASAAGERARAVGSSGDARRGSRVGEQREVAVIKYAARRWRPP